MQGHRTTIPGKSASALLAVAAFLFLFISPVLADFSGDFSQPGGSVYDGTSDDYGYGVAVDTITGGGPYIFVVGYSSGGANDNYFTIKYNASGVVLSSATFDGGYNDYGMGIALDSSGNVYVTGYSNNGLNDDCVSIKYNNALVLQSSAVFNSGNNDYAKSIAVGSDSVYVTGWSWNGTNFDYLTIKYNSSLVFQSSAAFNGGSYDYGNGIALDNNGNVYVTGESYNGTNDDCVTIKYNNDLVFQSSAIFNSGSNDNAKGVAVGSDSVYVTGGSYNGLNDDCVSIKYNNALVFQSSAVFNSGNNDYAEGVAVGSDSVYVTGWSYNGTNNDYLTIKYNSSLVFQSSAVFNGGFDDDSRGIAVGVSSYVYVTGGSSNGTNYDFRTIRYLFDGDTTPPAAVTNLSAQPGAAEGQVKLIWSMPGDDGITGILPPGSAFKIQISSIPDGTGDGKTGWLYQNAQITVSTNGVTPTILVSYVVSGLTPAATYYFRIWHADEVPNWSGLSNSATAYVSRSDVRIWNGGGTTNNASEAANWVDGVLPSTGDAILFNNTNGTKGCIFDIENVTFSSFTIAVGFSTSVALTGYSNFTVTNNFTIESGSLKYNNPTDNKIIVKGNWIQTGGIVDLRVPAGWEENIVSFEGASPQTVTMLNGSSFGKFRVNSVSTVTLNSNVTMSDIHIQKGCLDLGAGFQHTITDREGFDIEGYRISYGATLDVHSSTLTIIGDGANPFFDVGGTLRMDNGDGVIRLWLAGGTFQIGSAATLIADSIQDIIRSTAPGSLPLQFLAWNALNEPYSKINITGLTLESVGPGFSQVFSTNTNIISASNIRLTNFPPDESGLYLSDMHGNFDFNNWYFDVSVTTNVDASNVAVGAATIMFTNATGPKAGPQYEYDPNNVVFWSTPTAPSQLRVLSDEIGTNFIQWRWNDDSNDEQGYKVFSSTGGQISPDLAANSMIFYQSSLIPNTSYSVFVKAFNPIAESTPTVAIFTYTHANPPSGTQITQVSSFAVTLSWNHNSNPSAYTTYLVWRATDSGGGWANIIEADFPGMPGSPWTDDNFGSGLTYGTSYFYKVQAKNEDGFTTGYDTTVSTRTHLPPPAPASGILYPPANSYHKALNVVSGTAAALADGASIAEVQVFIFDIALGKYWNGAGAWSLDAESWFAAAVYPSSWTYDTSAAVFQNDKEYRVVSRAVDTFSNYEIIRATAVFRIDTAPAASGVTYPLNNNSYSSLVVVSGTAADTANASFNSGVSSVKIRMARQSDGFFWNGADWVAGDTWLDGAGTAAWSYNSLPAFTSGYYIVNSRSYDVAGNDEVAFSTSAFYITGPATRLVLTVPGETFAPGAAPGKTGSPTARTAGSPFVVTAFAVDNNYYFDASTNAAVSAATSDVYDTEPAAQTLVGGTTVFVLNLITGGTSQISISASQLTSAATNVYVQPATATKLQILAPGETAVPGKITAAPYGKSGVPTAQTAGAVFSATVNLVDNYYNKVALNEPLVGLTTSDPYDTEPSSGALVSGMLVFPVTFVTASTATVTASDIDGAGAFYSPDTSPVITVNSAIAAKLIVVLPGETFAPGSPTGKAGSPSTRITGQSFSITVRAADAYWNIQPASNPLVNIITSDPADSHPSAASLVSGEKTFSVTFVTAGSWTICATDMDGNPLESSTSAVVNVLDETPPAAVTDITGQPGVSDGAIVLNWPAPGDNGWASPLPAGSMFKIQHSTWAGVSWSTTAAQITISTSGVTPTAQVVHTVEGLTGWTTYYFKIWHADNAPNWSGLSNTATSYAADFAAPGVPSLVSPSSGAATNTLPVDFSWDSSTDGGSGVAGYEFYISTSGDPSVFVLSAAPVSTSVNVVLPEQGAYQWRVRAKDKAGNFSTYSAAYTLAVDTTPPSAPALVSPADGASSSGSTAFQWGVCSDDLSGLKDYKLEIAVDEAFSSITVTTVSVSNAPTVGGLTDGVKWWRVSSRDNALNYSAASSTRNFTVTASAPAAPTSLSGTVISTVSVRWNWLDNADSETGYRIQNAVDEIIIDGLAVDTTFYTESGLSPNTAYTRRVRAYNGAGASAKSNDAAVYTLANPPSNLTSLSRSAASISLSWTAGGGGNTCFAVARSSDGILYQTLVALADAKVETNYTDAASIKPDTTYYYRVAGYNGAGVVTAFTPVIAVKSAAVPPDTISGKITQADGKTPIAALRVDAVSPDGTSVYFAHTSTDGSYTISAVAPGKYRVQAGWALNDIVSSVHKDDIRNGSVGVDFTLEVSFAPSSISGVIRKADAGVSAPGARRTNGPLAPEEELGETFVEILKDGGIALRVYADNSGYFEIGNLMPGSYVVRAFNGLAYSAPKAVAVAEGQTAVPAFAFSPIAGSGDDVYAYPNPARSSAIIRFRAGVASPKIELKIYNITAELIRSADQNDFAAAGSGVRKFDWDLNNSSGKKVASGVYIYVLKVSSDDGEESVVKKKLAIIK